MNYLQVISETAIQRVQQETGMEPLQARRHLQARTIVADAPVLYPLGKSAYMDTDAEYALWAQRNPDLVGYCLKQR